MSSILSAIQGYVGIMYNDDDVLRIGEPGVVEKFYKKLAASYNMTELEDILNCDDNMLIVACAGAGKTTTLLLKIIRDVLAGKLTKTVNINGIEVVRLKKILVSTFLKSGAEDLAKKFDDLCSQYKIENLSSKDISFRTIHSEVYAALQSMGVTITIAGEEELRKYLADSCRYFNIHSLASNSKGITKEELSDIESIVSYYRNRLDDNKCNHPLVKEYNLNDMTLKAMVQRFNSLKEINRVQDFEDLEELLYDGYSKFPRVVQTVSERYDYIYVDEFQDTSQLQYGILEPYFKTAEGILAIGDDDQCIYSWRGSDINIITERFKNDYKPTIKHLSVNRRCPKVILDAVIPSIENNSMRNEKELKASKEDGKIDVIVDGGIRYLSEAIKEDLAKSERVGILGRTNADLIVPAMVLLLDNYTSFSVSKSVNLSGRMTSQIIGVMDLITQRYNNNFEGYFKLFTSKYNSYQATKLCDILANDPKLSIYNIPMDDLKYSVPSLVYLIRLLRRERDKDPVGAYISLLCLMESEVYNGRTIYAQRARDFIYYMIHLIEDHEALKGKSIEELHSLFNVEIPKKLDERIIKRQKREVDGRVEYFVPEDTSYVRITTVHDAKGKEWDNVYIWNDIDGCFPNSVGNRELSQEEFEEERRVHYIAWTRAKKKLTIFTRSDTDNGFICECDLKQAVMRGKDGKVLEKRPLLISMKPNIKNFIQHSDKATEEKVKDSYDWRECLVAYINKYTSYDKICTTEGSNLDMCLVKMGGKEALADYLEECHIGDYPKEDIESAITDLIESKLDTLM